MWCGPLSERNPWHGYLRSLGVDTGLWIVYCVCMNNTRQTQKGVNSNMAKTKTQKTYTPKELAESLGISPKVLRAYLRKEHARSADAKNTSWVIPASVAAQAKKAFAKNVASA